MLLGQIIKDLRKEAKLTQTDLAGLVGLTPANISQIEHGSRWGKRSRTLFGITNILSCFGCKLAVIKDDEIIAVIDEVVNDYQRRKH